MKRIITLTVAVIAALLISSCAKDNPKITNTLVYDGKTYKIDFMAVTNGDSFDSDIHFLEESDLEQAWAMMWAVGKLGTYTLPADKENFMLTKNTYPDYEIDFKSGQAKVWRDDDGKICIFVDGKTKENKNFKLSAKSIND